MSQPNPKRSPKPDHAPVFAALGDRTRLALLARLYAGEPKSITELSHGGTVTRQAITKHLRVLERAGIVRCKRAGRESLFAFTPAPLDAAQQYFTHVAAEWDKALARLKAFVEDDA